MYEAYKDRVIFMMIYIREAHPAFPHQTVENAGVKKIGEVVYHQPKTFEERRKLAETACTYWELPMPTLVDTMKPCVNDTYRAWPNRIYLIDASGKIVFRGVLGPAGGNARPAEVALRKLLGLPEGEYVSTEGKKSTERRPSRRGSKTPAEK